jgi:hypothetical protein
MRARLIWGLVMATAVLAAAVPARSAPIMITVGGTSITVDGETQDGLFNWIAAGADQLTQQWVWFRQGNTAEASLDTLDLVEVSVGTNSILLGYESPTGLLSIAVTYTLTGGTQPRIDESIQVVNDSSTPTELALFLYSDLDVNAEPINTASGGVNGIAQTQGNTTIDVRPVGPVPAAFQIAFFPDLLNLLNDGVATNLNNSGNGLGPADLSHAFQWNLSLAPGQTVTLGAVKEITQVVEVPQPSSVALLMAGLILTSAMVGRVRRGSSG